MDRAIKNKRREGKTKLIAFGWDGGNYSHLDWLLPLEVVINFQFVHKDLYFNALDCVMTNSL